jgi:DNA-binding transcriptional MerR regulator
MSYVRVKDLEKIIDRDRNTILRWEREGKIPQARKDSRGWRFYNDEDINLIQNYLRLNNPYYEISQRFLNE